MAKTDSIEIYLSNRIVQVTHLVEPKTNHARTIRGGCAMWSQLEDKDLIALLKKYPGVISVTTKQRPPP